MARFGMLVRLGVTTLCRAGLGSAGLPWPAVIGLLVGALLLGGLPSATAQTVAVQVTVDPSTAGATAAYRLRWTPGTQGTQTIGIEFRDLSGAYTTVPTLTASRPS